MKERPERKVIFEITGDGLTAEEVGRIRQDPTGNKTP